MNQIPIVNQNHVQRTTGRAAPLPSAAGSVRPAVPTACPAWRTTRSASAGSGQPGVHR
jgi:hypothetical protein